MLKGAVTSLLMIVCYVLYIVYVLLLLAVLLCFIVPGGSLESDLKSYCRRGFPVASHWSPPLARR